LAALLVLTFALSFLQPALAASPTDGSKKAKSARSAKATKDAKASVAAPKSQKSQAGAASNTKSSKRSRVKRVAKAPARPSQGELLGLHRVGDPLELKSGAAIVVDQESDEVLFSKNAHAILPIASLTKLMTAVVVLESGRDLDEPLIISPEAVVVENRKKSKLVVGATASRRELLHLALMSSENRAARALSLNHPGGEEAFVAAMNRKAREIGMVDTRFVESTGLSSANRSSAKDLAELVKVAYFFEDIRKLSTSSAYEMELGERQVQYRNTNLLVNNPTWQIGLQKTGYISAAGRCLAMQASFAGRKLVMIFLDSAGRYSRLGDAERVRRWLSEAPELMAPKRPQADRANALLPRRT
jgi:serine-type D-Ala-D-Ala endopeptidase (penicillin-binding protein 7)